MVSSTDGWAVGDSGIIIRWDGSNWENVTSPTTKHLFSVDMINSTDGWAVGSDGMHYPLGWNKLEKYDKPNYGLVKNCRYD